MGTSISIRTAQPFIGLALALVIFSTTILQASNALAAGTSSSAEGNSATAPIQPANQMLYSAAQPPTAYNNSLQPYNMFSQYKPWQAAPPQYLPSASSRSADLWRSVFAWNAVPFVPRRSAVPQPFSNFLDSSLGSPSGISTHAYASPSCGPDGGSTGWACAGWPTTTPPALGAAGTVTTDPDTGNRVLRITQAGDFGESPGTAFKVFDAGWENAWNADDTRVIVMPWSTGKVKHTAYWLGFDPSTMSLTGARGAIPASLANAQWDQHDPNLVVGLVNGVAKGYNVMTGAWTTLFDPSGSGWGASPWIAGFGGSTICIAEGPQDEGYRIACHNRQTGATQSIDLRSQTINGNRLPVMFQESLVALPDSVGIHTITLAPDGNWLAVDTHGNAMCTSGSLRDYASTALFIDLATGAGYEWNVACGSTHWAYGYNGAMVQSASAKWTATGANSLCSSDSRGIGKRTTDNTIDASYIGLTPCAPLRPATWSINVHLSWTNNRNDASANTYPVLISTQNDGAGNVFLANDIAAVETAARPQQGRIWRFAQTWNDKTNNNCGFLDYASPAVSRNGRWALFPSNWHGQTSTGVGVCNGKRTDVFLFELK